MSAYVFYCSRCKFDHAGECPPERRVTVARTTAYPAVGSVWLKQVKPILPVRARWIDGISWRVDEFDASMSGKVAIRAVNNPTLLQFYEVEAWDEDGWTSADSDYRTRFVKET